MSKTVQVLLTQIQEHILEYKHGCGKSDVPSASDPVHPDPCEWNFPGLRKNIAPVYSSSGDREDQEKGIGELLMLQQRTVLQVRLIHSFTSLLTSTILTSNDICDVLL